MSNVVRERLGNAVKQLTFDRGRMDVPALSVQHVRNMVEHTAGPVVKLVEFLSATDLGKLGAFRSEYDSLISEYFEENIVRQDYLLTKATKS